jgi:DNA-binding response OmpR family regulator
MSFYLISVPFIRLSNTVLTLNKLELCGPEGTVRLSLSEALLLRAFALEPEGRLGFERLAHIFGVTPTELGKSSLQVRIVRLRKKLYDTGAHGAVIEAIRNVGYQFFEPIEIVKS